MSVFTSVFPPDLDRLCGRTFQSLSPTPNPHPPPLQYPVFFFLGSQPEEYLAVTLGSR